MFQQFGSDKKELWKWDCVNGHQGMASSYDEAVDELIKYIDLGEEMWDVESCDGNITYFYASEDEADNDFHNGAYAPQVTRMIVKW